MVRPIEPFAKTNKEYHYEFPNNGMENEVSNGGKKKAKKTYLLATKSVYLAKILEVPLNFQLQ